MESFSRAQRGKYILPIVILLFALLILGTSRRALADGGSVSPDGIARPVTVNFDTLPRTFCRQFSKELVRGSHRHRDGDTARRVTK